MTTEKQEEKTTKTVPPPRLRFKQFERQGEWEGVKLGDITQVVSQRNKSGEKLPIYSISNLDGFIPQSDQFDGVDSHERGYDISLYKVVGKNTFAYNPARINVGSIGYSGDLTKVIVSSLYVCFKTNSRADDFFLWRYLKSEDFTKAVKNMAEGGIRSYLFYEKFAEIEFFIPPLPEQQHIAATLSSLDDLITAHTDKLEALRQHKRGLMQALFPAEGERVPRLRFPEFAEAGEWEKKAVGEVANIYQPATITSTDLKPFGYPVYGANGQIGFFDDYNHDTWQTLVTCRGSTSGVVSRSVDKSWITGNAMVMNVDDSMIVDKNYFYHLIARQNFSSIVSGSGQPQITRKPLADWPVSLPSLPEQQRIAASLSSLDDLITAQADKIAALQEFKRGLMQGLFPSTTAAAQEAGK